MYFDVTAATYQGGYKIKLVFEDGKKGVVDLSSYINKGVFSRFRDLEYFKKFYIEHGVLIWGNGELDIAPETLYCAATGTEEIAWDGYDVLVGQPILQVREDKKGS